MKIHLACGMRRLPGYVHVDARDLPGLDHVANVQALPFDADSADLVYWCHGLEHVWPEHVDSVLKELWRVLKPEGVLRLAVPDFSGVAQAHVGGVSLERLQGLVFGRQDYPENTHYAVYDYETLCNVLRRARFYDAKPWLPYHELPQSYTDYSHAKVYDARGKSYAMSLNVEAKKF